MKNFDVKRNLTLIAMIAVLVMAFVIPTSAATGFDAVVKPVVDLINSFMTPLLMIVGAAGSIYCVFLGIKYAKAEEVQEREKAKSHLKNAIIGFVLIFVLILALDLLMPVMQEWVADEAVRAASETL